MSFIPNSLFDRRYEPPPNHHIWDPKQDHSFGPALTTIHLPTSPIVVSANIEWKETPGAHVYRAYLYGLRQNEVRVEVHDDRELCIIGQRKVEKEERINGRRHLVERARGHFIQRLMLPQNSKVDRVKAYMDNAVLTITVPKH